MNVDNSEHSLCCLNFDDGVRLNNIFLRPFDFVHLKHLKQSFYHMHYSL